jgi:hypothetical protein
VRTLKSSNLDEKLPRQAPMTTSALPVNPGGDGIFP